MAKRILVADDDPAIVEVLQLMLEEDGYHVETTTDGATVLHPRHRTAPPDLILLDVWMSGLDGREICRQLKQDAAMRHIPIVLVSANNDIARVAGQCGADAFVAKPFEMNDVLDLVKRYTGERL